MQHPETQHRVNWLDRLRIERVVWSLDQRLYDLPRRTRIETRREVRQNLLTGARDVGTTQALRNLGSSWRTGRGISVGRVRLGPTALLDGSGVFALLVPLLATSFFADAATAFATGSPPPTRTPPARTPGRASRTCRAPSTTRSTTAREHGPAARSLRSSTSSGSSRPSSSAGSGGRCRPGGGGAPKPD